MPNTLDIKVKRYVAILTLLLTLFVLFLSRGLFIPIAPNPNNLSNSLLVQILAEMKYQAFTPPRAQDATGSLVRLHEHGESVVSSTCFESTKVPVKEVNVSLGAYKYSQSGSDDLVTQSYWPAGLRNAVNNSLAKSEVETVNIEFINPRQVRFEELDLKQYINNLSKGDNCRKAIEQPGVFIIQSAILVDGMAISFLSMAEQSALSKAELKNLAENEIQHNKILNQDYKLIFDDSRFIGYRPLFYETNPAVSGDGQLVQPLFDEFFQEKWH